jgi:putative ABC transport system substrate-binding protein
MKRRALIAAIGALAAVPLARAQRAPRVFRVGILSAVSSADVPVNRAFVQRMQNLGYVEGRNVLYEWRHADSRYERFPGLAKELVARNVDVIVASGTPAIPAAMAATRTIPIVMATSTDPVANGFVASLARPGGNVTGLSNISAELGPKHLELLTILLPKLARVAVLMDPRIASHPLVLQSVEAAAARRSVKVVPAQAAAPEELAPAFESMKKGHADAAIAGLSGLFIVQGQAIAALSLRHRIPVIFPAKQSVIAGGLISYGQDLVESSRRSADFVDRILKGAKPGDLPIEQPTRFELVINLKMAKALGLAIPQSLLLRTDRVIE